MTPLEVWNLLWTVRDDARQTMRSDSGWSLVLGRDAWKAMVEDRIQKVKHEIESSQFYGMASVAQAGAEELAMLELALDTAPEGCLLTGRPVRVDQTLPAEFVGWERTK